MSSMHNTDMHEQYSWKKTGWLAAQTYSFEIMKLLSSNLLSPRTL
jgi:hypothetical protein